MAEGTGRVPICRRVSGAFDRFIPYRPNLDVEASNARLHQDEPVSGENEAVQYTNPGAQAYGQLLSDAFPITPNGKVLPISSSSPRPSQSHSSPFAINMSKYFRSNSMPEFDSPELKKRRKVPSSPDCIMDMPGLRDDFYTNLLDWNSNNLVAIALNKSTYVWSADSKECTRIEEDFDDSELDCYVSALSWHPRDSVLAIADNRGDIIISNTDSNKKPQRKIAHHGQSFSIGVILWTDFGITTGDRKGRLLVRDPRRKGSKASLKLTTGRRSMEVCGLKLAPGTHYLASGGDDGLVNIWDLRMSKCYRSIKAHDACSKALCWCPYRSGVIATGGGSNDGHLRLWNIHSGEKLAEVYTKSQVCGLLWSEDYFELVSAHGSPQPEKNDIVIWNMRQFKFEPIAKLRQHIARPLHISLGADGTTFASAGADESLCLWKVFPRKIKRHKNDWDFSPLNLTKYVR